MIEVAMVFDKEGKALFWLGPRDHTSSSIPDSQVMWQRIWEYRDIIGGVAHTHPWDGHPWPSDTDVTTFSAVERGLGKRLIWPIITMDDASFFKWFHRPNSELYYQPVKWPYRFTTHWLENIIEMRRLSSS